jgi:hypothetical protein
MFHIPDKPKAVKIVRVALDQTARAREWQKAAVAFSRHLRDNGVTAPELISPLVNFGKYKGRTVEWIVDHDPVWCEWVLANFTDLSPFLRKELTREMEALCK